MMSTLDNFLGGRWGEMMTLVFTNPVSLYEKKIDLKNAQKYGFSLSNLRLCLLIFIESKEANGPDFLTPLTVQLLCRDKDGEPRIETPDTML